LTQAATHERLDTVANHVWNKTSRVKCYYKAVAFDSWFYLSDIREKYAEGMKLVVFSCLKCLSNFSHHPSSIASTTILWGREHAPNAMNYAFLHFAILRDEGAFSVGFTSSKDTTTFSVLSVGQDPICDSTTFGCLLVGEVNFSSQICLERQSALPGFRVLRQLPYSFVFSGRVKNKIRRRAQG
jgi:hypothetical protein